VLLVEFVLTFDFSARLFCLAEVKTSDAVCDRTPILCDEVPRFQNLFVFTCFNAARIMLLKVKLF
jgi:hypothetical protein